MIGLYRDPEGKNVFTHSLPYKQQKTEGSCGKVPMSTIETPNGNNDSNSDSVTTLRARVKLLEERLQSNGIPIEA